MKNQLFAFLCLFLIICPCLKAHAISIIRDTEVENVLTNYVRLIFKEAGLNPDNAKIILVKDDSINAFVAGGQTIFIHTGLITHSKSIDDLIFVLAHETGHIKGGHLIRGYDVNRQIQTTALVSSILGGLAALAAGRPDAGVAIMMGGSTSAMGVMAGYQQSEESAADRTAVDIIQKTGYSMQGFSEIMKLLNQQERLNSDEPSLSYLRTHPITRDRLNILSRFTNHPKPLTSDLKYDLIKAKLIGFLYPVDQINHYYPPSNTSVSSRYAQAILLYRNHKIDASLKKIDTLIKEYPKNPYFYELKAQFLLETARIESSIETYKKAIRLKPDAFLIRLSLSQALLETDRKEYAQEAQNHLKQVISVDPDIPFAWQLLATAYDRTGHIPERSYALAEYSRTIGDIKNAKKLASQVLKSATSGTPLYQKAQDILQLPEKNF